MHRFSSRFLTTDTYDAFSSSIRRFLSRRCVSRHCYDVLIVALHLHTRRTNCFTFLPALNCSHKCNERIVSVLRWRMVSFTIHWISYEHRYRTLLMKLYIPCSRMFNITRDANGVTLVFFFFLHFKLEY